MVQMVIGTIGAWVGAYAVVFFLGLLLECLFHVFSKSGIARSVKLLLFIPGIVVHEIGHAIACVLTGKRIEKIHFSTHEGYVRYDPGSGIRTPLAYCLIAFASIVSCGTVATYF
jgi:hypothetical protein